MFDFGGFITTHLEHINMAIFIVLIILAISTLVSGGVASPIITLILAWAGIAVNVVSRYPHLFGASETQSSLIV